jgi:hypothetical protein
MLLPSATVASRYYNCCTGGNTMDLKEKSEHEPQLHVDGRSDIKGHIYTVKQDVAL